MASYWGYGAAKYTPQKVEEKPYFSYDLNSFADDISGIEYLGGKFVSGIESIFKGAENLFRGTFYQLTGNTYAAEKLYAENDPQARSKKLDQQYKGQNYVAILTDLGNQVKEVKSLLRVKAGGRLVYDQNFGISEESLGNACPAEHTAGITGQELLALVLQARNRKATLHLDLDLVLVRNTLDDAHVFKEFHDIKLRHQLGVLGQIAEDRPIFL